MKTIPSLLIIAVLAIIKVQAGDFPSTPNSPPSLSKPTWGGDDHDQPVFTSPTNAPAITNQPATDLPTNKTNPPTLQPPSGFRIVQ